MILNVLSVLNNTHEADLESSPDPSQRIKDSDKYRNKRKYLRRISFFYKKELTFGKVTDALFIFAVRQCNAVQICLMAVIKKIQK